MGKPVLGTKIFASSITFITIVVMQVGGLLKARADIDTRLSIVAGEVSARANEKTVTSGIIGIIKERNITNVLANPCRVVRISSRLSSFWAVRNACNGAIISIVIRICGTDLDTSQGGIIGI